MKRSLLIFSLLYFVLLLCACDSKESEQKAASDTAEVPDTDMDQDEKTLLIPPGKLSTLLPESIPGAEKLPTNTGTHKFKASSWSSASAEYAFKKGVVIIQINDYGKMSNMPEDEQMLFVKLPEFDGANTEKVGYKGGVGYVSQAEDKSSGKLQLLFADRFTLNLDSYNLAEDNPGLLFYLKYIDVNKFEELIEN
jgi:hypothetical protein